MENVTIDRLFRVHRPVEVLGHKLSVRCLSGPESQDRDRYSLMAGLTLEKKLRDHESEEYLTTLSGYKSLDREGLVAFLTVNYVSEATSKAEEKYPLLYQPFPDDALEDERRKTLETRQEIEAKRDKDVAIEVKRLLEQFEKSLADTPVDQLLVKVEGKALVHAINRASNDAYAYYALYLSVCDESGKRYFSSPEEPMGLPDTVTIMLIKEFKEVNSLDPLALSGQFSTALPATTGVSPS